MKKIVTVIGARPQFIKASVVSRQLIQFKKLHEIIVHTGQHYDENMSGIFFKQMQLTPTHNLAIGNLPHGAMTGRMIEKIEEILLHEKPEFILVYGDTNSTLAAALAAAKLHIKVAHVEAGLRSFNRKMPEEINRVVTDHISDILFCPTQNAIKNLSTEGITIDNRKVLFCGDVMYDASVLFEQYIQQPKFTTPGEFILSTIHRQENTDDKSVLKNIIDALNELNKEIPVVMPVHPRTKKMAQQYGYKILFDAIEPLGYLQMMAMLKECTMVITDSGGLQKEAFFYKKPCVIIRDATEWIELIQTGASVLAHTTEQDILEKAKNMLESQIDFDAKLFGNGNAAYKIASFLNDV